MRTADAARLAAVSRRVGGVLRQNADFVAHLRLIHTGMFLVLCASGVKRLAESF